MSPTGACCRPSPRQETGMGYKTILVHCDASPKVAQRLAAAADLARRHGAHLVGVHVQEPFNAPEMFEASGAMDQILAVFEATAKAELATAKAAFVKAVKGQELSTEWRSEEGFADTRLPVHARYADLVIVGQADPEAPYF